MGGAVTQRLCEALVSEVDPASPAARAGLQPGDVILAVDGQPVRDILDWQWLTTEGSCVVSYRSARGERGEVLLERSLSEPWGIAFAGILFDGVRTCRNACTFCFMRQLPKGLRRTLYVRDDDFRLSFLQGNFVTLTNLDAQEVARIQEQRISPLRASLHAVDAQVRQELMGKNAQVGLQNLEALLDAGINVDAQIVLVPGVNDGAVLEETLEWAYVHSNIQTVGIVPLGYTRHQDAFSSGFDDPASALTVLKQLFPFQERAEAERGSAWAFAADEFYLTAFGDAVLDHLPDAAFYGDFAMYEDGIGIVRSSVDGFREAQASGVLDELAQALDAAGERVVMVCGCAMERYLPQLIAASPLRGRLEPLFVENAFFGGNVNVTGLLAGADMACAIRQHVTGAAGALYLLPAVAFNVDGVTVDDLTEADIAHRAGKRCLTVPSNPLDCIEQLLDNVKDR